jgi:hypothetical protein
MVRAGRRRVLQYFSGDAIAQGLRDRYETLRKPVVNLV